ncbi:unnamed protein product [Didymodactylos carnosus]|uniref:RING-type domain-containing protein n=1 Tax=Didymodactylos carnosus TaxID=1234261 RepID=A0A814KU78_9BILA|nr:unnamed protein product [Didymodactylos carnosus]CAF3824511.1 unnamed protein product [Didymodactylos carnosus]
MKPARRVVGKPEPLYFNKIHGKRIILSDNNKKATRLDGFADSIVFSSRTIRTYERVYIRHHFKQVDWIGSLRIGFTEHNPETSFTLENLPNLAFKNLTEQTGYWLRAVSEDLLKTNQILYFYYSFDGSVNVGIYGQEAQSLLTMNDSQGPYFFMMEVYGKTDIVEIVDDVGGGGDASSIYRSTVELINSKINDRELWDLQYFSYLFTTNSPQSNLTFFPNIPNIILTNSNKTVCVNNLKKTSAYAFIQTQMKIGDVLICKIMDCDSNISATLLFGLTTCNPTLLQNKQLPDETPSLINQYSSYKWCIEFDLDTTINMYDELAFYYDQNGCTYLSKNNQQPIRLSLKLDNKTLNSDIYYPFFDLYGQVTAICLYSISNVNNLKLTSSLILSPTIKLLCSICYERLANAVLIPCGCRLCYTCGMMVKKPTLISDCPFDRKSISDVRKI